MLRRRSPKPSAVIRTPILKSRARHEAARSALPGGNTRGVLYYPPFPLAIARGEGAYLWDFDGHRYVDFLCEYTAGLCGHTDPTIRAAVEKALRDGILMGAPNAYEARFAEAVVARFPSIERVRFCNSGTEANLYALGAARAVTGREKILAFDGSYHGGVLSFDHRRSPMNVPFPMVFGTYNDSEGTRALIERHRHELAAVILEPVWAGGYLPAEPAFVQALREATERHGIVLVFDEVITSRLGPNGAQGLLGVTPDMTALGKWVGGGLTFGAFGGRADIMDRFDPSRADALPHSGTFNNNVLTMAAGLAALTEVFTPEAAVAINQRGDALRERLNAAIRARGRAMQVTGRGSVMGVHFADRPLREPADVPGDGLRLGHLMHLDMLSRDQYTARWRGIALSLPMGEAEIDGLVVAFEGFLDDYGSLLDSATQPRAGAPGPPDSSSVSSLDSRQLGLERN